jgi:manganese efflux pump family protein
LRITWELLVLAFGLGCDAFSVAICVGLAGATMREKIRLASGFGAFQFLMPIAGLAVGHYLGGFAGTITSYIGGALLVGLGVAMIWRTLSCGFTCPALIHTSFLALVTASIGVSLDALAVGFGYGMSIKHSGIVSDSLVIGITAFIMTMIGAEVGGQAGKVVQHRAPVLGGIILVGLGAHVILMTALH